MMESQYYLYMLTPLHSVKLFTYAHACYIFIPRVHDIMNSCSYLYKNMNNIFI